MAAALTVGRCVAVVGLIAAAVACSSAVVACSSPPVASPPSPTASPPAASSTSRAARTPTPTTARSTAPSTSTAGPAGQLPGDLTPNVVEDECLLTAEELGALVGRTALRAENTELAAGGARRSCFYAPAVADEPVARIDVYASASLPPPELVAKIAANGGKALAGIGKGAVVVAGQGGASELAVASASLLAVLTVLPGGAAAAPSDQAWVVAGTAIAGRLG